MAAKCKRKVNKEGEIDSSQLADFLRLGPTPRVLIKLVVRLLAEGTSSRIRAPFVSVLQLFSFVLLQHSCSTVVPKQGYLSPNMGFLSDLSY
jgi:hypothetical protein